jgi:hypothetical protein
MNHYLRAVLNVLFVFASLGFVVPFLISSPSDLGVIGGIAYLVPVMPIVLYYVNRNYVNNLVSKVKEKINEV